MVNHRRMDNHRIMNNHRRMEGHQGMDSHQGMDCHQRMDGHQRMDSQRRMECHQRICNHHRMAYRQMMDCHSVVDNHAGGSLTRNINRLRLHAFCCDNRLSDKQSSVTYWTLRKIISSKTNMDRKSYSDYTFYYRLSHSEINLGRNVVSLHYPNGTINYHNPGF